MTKVRVRSAATADIRSIRIYSKERFGVEAARHHVSGLLAVFDTLGERLRIGRGERGFGGEVRSFGYRSHRIYYRITQSTVEIIRILHHSQDVSSQLGQSQ